MSGPIKPSDDDAARQLRREVDRMADRFESVRHAILNGTTGPAPQIEAFLAEAPEPLRPALLQELIRLEIECRYRDGQEPRPEDYLGRFPSLDRDWLEDEIAAASPEADAQRQVTLSEAGDPGAAQPRPSFGRRPRRVRCPHCQNPLLLSDDRATGEILCPGCGGSFNWHDARLTSTKAPMRQVGKFRLLEHLGTGGFGAVWKAHDTMLDRIVALKISHAGALQSQPIRERFHREARATAQLRHPGIVPVHEVVELETESGRLPAIVSDFVAGVTLRDLLDTRKRQTRPLSYRESCVLVAQVAEALDYAHRLGVIHRDIKPANLMIEYPPGLDLGARLDEDSESRVEGRELRVEGRISAVTGQGASDSQLSTLNPQLRAVRPRPMILDFGLALRGEESTLTLEGQILGTPAYMSPEQAEGRSHRVDARSDVYSLGVVLYELLCGELPFRGSHAVVINRIVNEEPRPPRQINDRIPRDLETICLKAMSKSPVQRFTTARDLAAELHRYVAGEPILARPVGQLERAWRWARRNPLTASLTAFLSLSILLMAVGGTAAAVYFRRLAASESKAKANALTSEQKAKSSEQATRFQVNASLTSSTWLLKDEDLTGSLSWLAGAWMQDPDRARDPIHQLRLASVFHRCPKPVRLWFNDRAMPMRHADFSPTQDRVVAAGGRAARVYNVGTGELVGEPLRHPGIDEVIYAEFSPDGRHVVTACTDGTARVWDAWTANPVTQPLKEECGKRIPYYATFSPDARQIAVGEVIETPGAQRGWVVVWNAETGEKVFEIAQEKPVWQVAYSPDGKCLVAAGGTGRPEYRGDVRVYAAESGQPIDPPLYTGSHVYHLEFSPDGRLVALACANGTARICDITNRDHPHVSLRDPSGVPPHTQFVNRASFSPDGRRLVTASEDRTARVWDVATGEPRSPPMVHGLEVVEARFSPDGRYVATGCYDGVVQLWDATSGKPVGSPMRHNARCNSVRFSRDGRQLLTASADGTVRLWDLASSEWPVTTVPHEAAVLNGQFTKNGQFLVTYTTNRRLRVWRPSEKRAPWGTLFQLGAITHHAISPDGQRLLTADVANQVVLRDVASGDAIGQPIHADYAVGAVSFNGDADRFLIAGHKGNHLEITVFDTATRRPAVAAIELEGVADVFDAGFTPNGDYIFAITEAKKNDNNWFARFWDCRTGTCLGPYEVFSEINGVAFSADGQRIALATTAKEPIMLDVPSGKRSASLKGHNYFLRDVAFSSDGKRFVTASVDQTARVWDPAQNILSAPPLVHSATLQSARFSPDNRFVLTASGSVGPWRATGVARLWDSQTGEPVTPWLRHGSPDSELQGGRGHWLTSAIFRPDGRAILTTSWDGNAYLWELPQSSHSAEDYKLAAQALNGRSVNEFAAWEPLDGDKLRNVWEQVQHIFDGELGASPKQVRAWHGREAQEAFEGNDGAAAVFHITRLIEIEPQESKLYTMRGQVYAAQKQWELAVSDFSRAIDGTDDPANRGVVHV